MRGSNTLELNGATMIEAVQEYLNKRTTGISFKVISVTANSGGNYSGTFDVKIEEVIASDAPQKA